MQIGTGREERAQTRCSEAAGTREPTARKAGAGRPRLPPRALARQSPGTRAAPPRRRVPALTQQCQRPTTLASPPSDQTTPNPSRRAALASKGTETLIGILNLGFPPLNNFRKEVGGATPPTSGAGRGAGGSDVSEAVQPRGGGAASRRLSGLGLACQL